MKKPANINKKSMDARHCEVQLFLKRRFNFLNIPKCIMTKFFNRFFLEKDPFKLKKISYLINLKKTLEKQIQCIPAKSNK